MLRPALKISLKATMAFNGDDWLGFEFAWFELLSPCTTVGAMRMNC